MANSAGDARGSELEIRQQLIEDRRGRRDGRHRPQLLLHRHAALHALVPRPRQGAAPTARTRCCSSTPGNIFRQIDRAHRDFAPEQIEFLANIVRLYRGEEPETVDGSEALLAETLPDGAIRDVPGLCKVATLAEIEAQGWSLNPGRYVGRHQREARTSSSSPNGWRSLTRSWKR